mmetsp:Transcript_8757/g.27184  ORF Transcript_8757/g.27184 Transcript_8757/m.27184 type:complete len:439 (-) Transcript_8757:648-1964(-)
MFAMPSGEAACSSAQLARPLPAQTSESELRRRYVKASRRLAVPATSVPRSSSRSLSPVSCEALDEARRLRPVELLLPRRVGVELPPRLARRTERRALRLAQRSSEEVRSPSLAEPPPRRGDSTRGEHEGESELPRFSTRPMRLDLAGRGGRNAEDPSIPRVRPPAGDVERLAMLRQQLRGVEKERPRPALPPRLADSAFATTSILACSSTSRMSSSTHSGNGGSKGGSCASAVAVASSVMHSFLCWRYSRKMLAGLAGSSRSASLALAALSAAASLAIAAGLALRLRRRSFRRIVAFQWFLIAFSVRPGRSFAISAHLFPIRAWPATRVRSSSASHSSRRISGLRWLCQRSRHCLPTRPRSDAAITDQHFCPCFATSSSKSLSSSLAQCPLINSVPSAPISSVAPLGVKLPLVPSLGRSLGAVAARSRCFARPRDRPG